MLDAKQVERWIEDIEPARARVAAACSFYAQELGLKQMREKVDDCSIDDSAALRIVADFLEEEVINAVVARERENFASTPLHISAFPSLGDSFYKGFVLFSHPRLVALLATLDPREVAERKRRVAGDRRTMTFTGKPSFVKLVSGAALRLRRWAIEPFDDARDLSNNPPASRRVSDETLRAGETLHLGPFEEVEFLEAEGLVVTLLANSIGSVTPVALEIDVDTSEIVATTATSQAPTRLQMLTTVVRLFDRQDGFDEIRRLLRYDKHFVRWHAMREMLALDAERALPDLMHLRDADPQPSVRRAAGATINRFFPNQAA